MPKGIPNNRYTGEFKQIVVETMHKERLSLQETSTRFQIRGHSAVSKWERIYLEEGPAGLYVERRGRGNRISGKRQTLDKKVEEDLIAEVQRLRAENDYLKKLNVLVLEEERRNKRRR